MKLQEYFNSARETDQPSINSHANQISIYGIGNNSVDLGGCGEDVACP